MTYLHENMAEIDEFIESLQNQIDIVAEEDELSRLNVVLGRQRNIRNILLSDIQKAESFSENFREVNVFLMIRNKNDFVVNKQQQEMLAEYRAAGFEVYVLSKLDFEKYFESVFENDMITNFVYSRYEPSSYLNEDLYESTPL